MKIKRLCVNRITVKGGNSVFCSIGVGKGRIEAEHVDVADGMGDV